MSIIASSSRIRYWHIAILLIIGIVLIVYPLYEKANQRHQRNQILESWEALTRFEQFDQANNLASQSHTSTAPRLVTSSEQVMNMEQAEDVAQRTTETNHEAPVAQIDGYDIDGVISIDKIGLKAPIIRGTSVETLALSVTSMNEQLYPGDAGNYSLAGHRAFKYGEQFNRLLEVDVGDTIVINTLTTRFEYTVEDTFLVTPDEVSVLDSNSSKSEITLITCEPMRNPTHRFIVRGVLTKTINDET